MKIIVTHYAPDWDAILSVWIIKKYLPGWEESTVEFVPHGSRLTIDGTELVVETDSTKSVPQVIEHSVDHDLLHVDTGLGPLDHHETEDLTVCAATRCLEFVKTQNDQFDSREDKWLVRTEAVERMVTYVTQLDHFQEVFWPDAASDRYDFALWGILAGYKTKVQGDNEKIVAFGLQILDAVSHRMEEKIWAEHEIKQKGQVFVTKFGKGLAIESLDDDVTKLAQKMGYAIVIRKDPRKGYVRIKAIPDRSHELSARDTTLVDIDLSSLYERLKKIDSRATWYLHVSKRMILNSANRETKAVATTLPLAQIITLLLELYKV